MTFLDAIAEPIPAGGILADIWPLIVIGAVIIAAIVIVSVVISRRKKGKKN